jgi:RNA polymerase sigma-70 factor (ECF subfamily)
MSESGSPSEHGEDLVWARALAAGDREALARYERLVVPMIAAQLRGRGCTEDQIADIQQILRARLFVTSADGKPPAIASYAGHGKLSSFVLVAALREAIRLRERNRREPAYGDDALDALADRVAGTGDAPEKAPYREAFRVAVRDALVALAPRQRTLLRLHFIDALSIDQIGALMSVHRATAARWISDARDSIASGVRRQLAAQVGIDRFEVEDLMGWIHSRVDVSLSPLATSPERKPPGEK